MIGEGLIAMVWVLLGISFYNNGYSGWDWSNSTLVTNNIAQTLLGKLGGAMALIGVVVLPVTSGDTCFRSARLIVADWFRIDQKSTRNCLLISAAIFTTGYAIQTIGFASLWRYFGWSNQALAAIVLWVGAVFLKTEGKNPAVTLCPALFLTLVVMTSVFYDPLMHIQLSLCSSTIAGALCTALILIKFATFKPKVATASAIIAKGEVAAASQATTDGATASEN